MKKKYDPFPHLPILDSFSGGRSSAFMTKLLHTMPEFKHREKIVAFVNTGKEKEETLRFVNDCDKEWRLNVIWIEAVVDPGKGIGTRHKIVTYETADRTGKPFEDVIAKYGVPNINFPHCTRELKQAPMASLMKSLGFKDWSTAIGIRADEPKRLSRRGHNRKRNPWYPIGGDIVSASKQFVLDWCANLPFDLAIQEHEGNCDLCWKKDLRKRVLSVRENPEQAIWWARMEKKYGKGKYLFDHRTGLSVPEIADLAEGNFDTSGLYPTKTQLEMFPAACYVSMPCDCS